MHQIIFWWMVNDKQKKQWNIVKYIIKQFVMNDNQVIISIIIEIGKLIQIHYVLFINNVINVQQQWLNHINVNKNQQIIIKMDKRLMMMKKMNHNRIKISCDI